MVAHNIVRIEILNKNYLIYKSNNIQNAFLVILEKQEVDKTSNTKATIHCVKTFSCHKPGKMLFTLTRSRESQLNLPCSRTLKRQALFWFGTKCVCFAKSSIKILLPYKIAFLLNLAKDVCRCQKTYFL